MLELSVRRRSPVELVRAAEELMGLYASAAVSDAVSDILTTPCWVVESGHGCYHVDTLHEEGARCCAHVAVQKDGARCAHGRASCEECEDPCYAIKLLEDII